MYEAALGLAPYSAFRSATAKVSVEYFTHLHTALWRNAKQLGVNKVLVCIFHQNYKLNFDEKCKQVPTLNEKINWLTYKLGPYMRRSYNIATDM